MRTLRIGILLLAALLSGAAAHDEHLHTDADVAAGVEFAPQTGRQVPAGLEFDGSADAAELDTLLARAPSILTFAWFDCTNLCGLILNNLADSSAALGKDLDYQVIVVSMDETAAQEQAKAEKADLARRYPQAGIDERWYFLTANIRDSHSPNKRDSHSIDGRDSHSGNGGDTHSLAEAVGYHFLWDERKGQFAHPAGIIALDTGGRVRGFRSGINYRAADLRQLIAFAAGDQRAETTPAHPLLLLCYDYDPASGRYSLAIMKLLRLAAALCVLLLGVVLWRWKRREKMEEVERMERGEE